MIEYKIESESEIPGLLKWVRDWATAGIRRRKWITVTMDSDVTRTLKQNSKVHALIGDMIKTGRGYVGSTFIDMIGMDIEVAKTFMVDAFLTEAKLNGIDLPKKLEPETFVSPLTGNTLVVRPSTTKFGMKYTAMFIENLYAIGTMIGVEWNENSREYYEEAKGYTSKTKKV